MGRASGMGYGEGQSYEIGVYGVREIVKSGGREWGGGVGTNGPWGYGSKKAECGKWGGGVYGAGRGGGESPHPRC